MVLGNYILLQSCIMSLENDVLFNTINNVGIITFNREKTLNAITISMMTKTLPILRQWDNEKFAVILRGKGHFSAGGDVKSVLESKEKGYILPTMVYNVIYKLIVYKHPSIAIIDGITMGGGLGIAMATNYRVATEETVVAMPEVKIGMLPDVGGSYFLPRLKHRLGYYMALTGNSLKGKDVLRSGIATHFVPKIKIKDLEKSLFTCKFDEEFRRVLNEFGEKDNALPLAANINDIEHCFGGGSVEEILKRLEETQNDWSAKTIATMKVACPGSMKIALKALDRGRELDLFGCLQMDFRLVYWSLRNHDFKEGVRAVLIDKDQKPKWNPQKLSDVTEEYIDSFFHLLPTDKELRILSPGAKL